MMCLSSWRYDLCYITNNLPSISLQTSGKEGKTSRAHCKELSQRLIAGVIDCTIDKIGYINASMLGKRPKEEMWVSQSYHSRLLRLSGCVARIINLKHFQGQAVNSTYNDTFLWIFVHWYKTSILRDNLSSIAIYRVTLHLKFNCYWLGTWPGCVLSLGTADVKPVYK